MWGQACRYTQPAHPARQRVGWEPPANSAIVRRIHRGQIDPLLPGPYRSPRDDDNTTIIDSKWWWWRERAIRRGWTTIVQTLNRSDLFSRPSIICSTASCSCATLAGLPWRLPCRRYYFVPPPGDERPRDDGHRASLSPRGIWCRRVVPKRRAFGKESTTSRHLCVSGCVRASEGGRGGEMDHTTDTGVLVLSIHSPPSPQQSRISTRSQSCVLDLKGQEQKP